MDWYENMYFDYNADTNIYTVRDNLLGYPLGTFECDDGPGWVFMAEGGLIMDELPALANFYIDLQSVLEV